VPPLLQPWFDRTESVNSNAASGERGVNSKVLTKLFFFVVWFFYFLWGVVRVCFIFWFFVIVFLFFFPKES